MIVTERLRPEVFRLPIEKIRAGYKSDIYFARTKLILERDGRSDREGAHNLSLLLFGPPGARVAYAVSINTGRHHQLLLVVSRAAIHGERRKHRLSRFRKRRWSPPQLAAAVVTVSRWRFMTILLSAPR